MAGGSSGACILVSRAGEDCGLAAPESTKPFRWFHKDLNLDFLPARAATTRRTKTFNFGGCLIQQIFG